MAKDWKCHILKMPHHSSLPSFHNTGLCCIKHLKDLISGLQHIWQHRKYCGFSMSALHQFSKYAKLMSAHSHGPTVPLPSPLSLWDHEQWLSVITWHIYRPIYHWPPALIMFSPSPAVNSWWHLSLNHCQSSKRPVCLFKRKQQKRRPSYLTSLLAAGSR